MVIWIWTKQDHKLSRSAHEAIESDNLAVSPMVGLELTYLREVGRFDTPADEVLSDLRRQIGLRIGAEPFDLVCESAATLSWTRDPFDRLIAAQALVAGARLATADETIRANVANVIW